MNVMIYDATNSVNKQEVISLTKALEVIFKSDDLNHLTLLAPAPNLGYSEFDLGHALSDYNDLEMTYVSVNKGNSENLIVTYLQSLQYLVLIVNNVNSVRHYITARCKLYNVELILITVSDLETIFDKEK